MRSPSPGTWQVPLSISAPTVSSQSLRVGGEGEKAPVLEAPGCVLLGLELQACTIPPCPPTGKEREIMTSPCDSLGGRAEGMAWAPDPVLCDLEQPLSSGLLFLYP